MPNEDKIFENKIRRMVFNFIVAYPGVPFNNIRHIFELTDSNLRYHLNYLEKNNKVREEMEGGIRRFYPIPSTAMVPHNSPGIMEYQRLSTEQEQLLGIIKQFPGINQKELVVRSRMDRGKVIRNLSSLENLNIINNTKVQNNVCYEYIPDVEAKFILLKGLIIKFLNDEIDEETFLRLKGKLE